MAKINTYPVVSPQGDDKIIISDANGSPSNATKNVTVAGLQTFINDVPAPTLQEVTTSGNTTNKNITTQGIKSKGTRDTDLVVKVGDYDGSGNKTKLEVDVANKKVSVNSNILSLNKLGGNRTEITFNPTTTRSIAIPDTSGTIALTSDLPSASPWNPEFGSTGINFQAGNVGIGTISTSSDALTVDGQIKSTSIETSGILVEGNATIDNSLSVGTSVNAGSVTAFALLGDLKGTINTTTTGTTQPSTTDNNLIATTAFVQNLLGDIVSGLQFQSGWDASTDTPNLSTATPSNGDFWIVKIPGSTNLSGITTWAVGDWAIYIIPSGVGTPFWQKIDNSTSLVGTGTGNQVAKWSGAGASTTLTDSIITSTATAVGIGTGNPLAALDVIGGVKLGVDNSNSLSIDSDIFGTVFNTSNNGVVAPDITFNIGGQSKMTIDGTTGSIGIGVASPTSKLQVDGEINGTSLDIQANALVQGSLAVDDNASISGSLDVSGTATIGNVDVQNELSCGNDATFSSNVLIEADLTTNRILIEIPDNRIKVKNPGTNDQLEITGGSGVDVVSGDGLTLEVSDVFEFRGSAGISVFNGNVLSAFLDVSQITTSRNFQFPDNNGTIALLSDITPTTGPSEWVGQISQNGTSAPVIATLQTSTLFVGDRVTTPTAFRDITFSRNAVGTYRLAVNWTQNTVPTDATKLSIMFGDNVARVYTFTLGSINGVNYKEFLFRTYTPEGVEADDQLLGLNGAMTSVTLYP